MARQELRDRYGRLIGIRQEQGQRVEGRDASGQLRGWYDVNNNQTRDAGGMLVGTGDFLSSLITSRL
jgi:hypothetical protein